MCLLWFVWEFGMPMLYGIGKVSQRCMADFWIVCGVGVVLM